MRRTIHALLIVVPTLALASCSQPPLRASYDSDLPSERALAAARAHLDPDVSSRKLVSLLDSSDPAVRFLAVRVLQERTGEDFGYHYADPPEIRGPAVEAWVSHIRSMDDTSVSGE